jgi:hypothetical protein
MKTKGTLKRARRTAIKVRQLFFRPNGMAKFDEPTLPHKPATDKAFQY